MGLLINEHTLLKLTSLFEMDNPASEFDDLPPQIPFTIVAIGGSAGGLEAMRELLERLDTDTGMAYVYFQHLDPTKASMLAEILQRVTLMKVAEAIDDQTLLPNCVYVIPSNKDMTLQNNVLKLTPRPPKPQKHLPVDLFFVSLAAAQKENAIGIILSGTASDGTYGLKCVKLAGGITFAQDNTAKFDGMPSAAIAEGDVDMILPPVQIAEELIRIGKHSQLLVGDQGQNSIPVAESLEEMEKPLGDIIQRLSKETGVDFTRYKLNTIRRRITRRLLICRFDNVQDYLNYIIAHPEEIAILYQDVLIHVTSFFRDLDTVELVKKEIFPLLQDQNTNGGTIRIWVAGCSSGEETYSLAMLLLEVYGNKPSNTKIQIFGTDLSEHCIAKARLGIYTPLELSRVSEQRLRKFFEPVDLGYRIVKEIRDLCIFSVHNVLRDPPFSRMDLISCCNMMIYLNVQLQTRLISILHYALKPDAVLVLGKSESVNSAPSLFSQIDKKAKLYRRTQNATIRQSLNLFYGLTSSQTPHQKPPSSTMITSSPPNSMDNQIDQLLLRKYIPACLVVNHSLDILQFRGPASVFFEPSQGKATLNVLKMVKPSVAFEIQSLVNKCQKTGEPNSNKNLQIRLEANLYKVSVNVTPVIAADSNESVYCVTLQEYLYISDNGEENSKLYSAGALDLQKQLERAREEMHAIIDGRDANVEELQSANEEITSTNEELQTINEELETSKEEVESANEELQSINKELQHTNRQLSESYEYSDAVFETISEAVLILTPDFKVKVANTAFYEIFKTIRSETEGCLLFDLGTRQWDIYALRKQLKAVIAGIQPIENLEIDKFFPGVDQKVLLLNARRIRGIDSNYLILLAIKDISEQRKSQIRILQQEELFRNMANNIPVMIWTLDANESCNFMNKTRLEYTGRPLAQELGVGWMQDIHTDEREEVKEVYAKSFRDKVSFSTEYRLRKYDASYRWVSGAGNPNYSETGSFIGYVTYCVDIHDKKLALANIENIVQVRTKELKIALSQLVSSNAELTQFAYAASHDLQEPVRKILIFAEKLRLAAPVIQIDANDYLAKIYSSAERMRTLIRDLLNLTKLSEAERPVESVNLNFLIGVVMEDFDVLMSEKNVTAEIGDLPFVKGLPVQLHQLFNNLISNALKFSVPGKRGLIRITQEIPGPEDEKLLLPLEGQEKYIKIKIEDRGIGFQQEYAEEIFTIFKRLNGNKQSFPGSGIGLALCKKIVINHRGAIYATSEPGNGACFSILLPLSDSRGDSLPGIKL